MMACVRYLKLSQLKIMHNTVFKMNVLDSRGEIVIFDQEERQPQHIKALKMTPQNKF